MPMAEKGRGGRSYDGNEPGHEDVSMLRFAAELGKGGFRRGVKGTRSLSESESE